MGAQPPAPLALPWSLPLFSHTVFSCLPELFAVPEIHHTASQLRSPEHVVPFDWNYHQLCPPVLLVLQDRAGLSPLESLPLLADQGQGQDCSFPPGSHSVCVSL